MTTKPSAASHRLQFPDAPEPEDLNSYKFFHSLGNGMHLAHHLGKPETTIIYSEVYLGASLTSRLEEMLVPDLLIAFGVDPVLFDGHGGYAIDQQGKPPDFVLEIASHTTGRRDATVKRERYAAMGVLEYWRFDDTGGRYAGAPLAGDRLLEGAYQPVPVEQLDEETWQGGSEALHLDLRWERGQLGWYDPDTGRHIVRFEDERASADNAEAQLDTERANADVRIHELEEEVRRLRG